MYPLGSTRPGYWNSSYEAPTDKSMDVMIQSEDDQESDIDKIDTD